VKLNRIGPSVSSSPKEWQCLVVVGLEHRAEKAAMQLHAGLPPRAAGRGCSRFPYRATSVADPIFFLVPSTANGANVVAGTVAGQAPEQFVFIANGGGASNIKAAETATA
jgi:hypothetical protein